MNELTFGVSISLTGKYSPQAKESFEGINLWVDEVNHSGGLYVKELKKNLQIKLVSLDDGSNEEKCRSNINKLIKDERVDFLLGPYSSGLTLAAAETAEQNGVLLWNHGGSTDEVFEGRFTKIISTITPASEYFKNPIKMIRELDSSASTLVIIYAHNSGFSSNVARGAINTGKLLGFDITELTFISGIDDFGSLINKINMENVDLILGAGRAEDDIRLAKSLIELHTKSKAVGLVVASIKKFIKIFKDKANGFLSTSQWEKDITIRPDIGPTPLNFFSRFYKKYGIEPDYLGAQGYNIGLVIQYLIQHTGTIDNSSLLKASKEIEFNTFYGNFRLDPVTGDQVGHKMLTTQWQNGRKMIVYPLECSNTEPVYPMSAMS